MTKAKTKAPSQTEKSKMRPHSIDFSDSPSLTEQADMNKVDINQIVKRYTGDQLLAYAKSQIDSYQDLTHLVEADGKFSLSEAKALWDLAKTSFDRLPSDVREFFNHDPIKLQDAFDDPEKRPMLVEMGLVAEDSSIPLKYVRTDKGDFVPNPDYEAFQNGLQNENEPLQEPENVQEVDKTSQKEQSPS